MSIFTKIAKLPVGRLIGRVVMVAAPVAATAIGGPAAGALVVAALGAGAGVKKIGQKAEEVTGRPVHKVVAPVAVVGLPAALGALVLPFLDPTWVAWLCEFTRHMCEDSGIIPIAAVGGASAGALALVAHQLGKALEKIIDKRQ